MSEAKRVRWRSRSEPLIEPEIWFVSYHANIERGGHYARATRRFKSEAEAKQFADQIISDGWTAIAGTINPYTPKRIISPGQILNWIADGE